jgi:hypothetical protein
VAGNEDGDLLEGRLALEDLARHPACGGLDLRLDTGVLGELDGAVAAGAAGARRVGEEIGGREEMAS